MKVEDRPFVRAERADQKADVHDVDQQVAVIVCHGMGQQVPFETLDGVARLVRKEVRQQQVDSGGQVPRDFPEVRTRIVAQDGLKLGRAEFRYSPNCEVHIYEAYWAPLTAGKVGISDVFGFLKDAGFSGIDKARRDFVRYMFNEFQAFPTPFLAVTVQFALTLSLLISLAFMSAIIVAIGAARTLTQGESGWPSDGLMTDLTIDLGLFGVAALVTAILYWRAWVHERNRNQDNLSVDGEKRRPFLEWLIVTTVLLTIVVAIGVGVLFALHLNMGRPSGAERWWNNPLAEAISGDSTAITVTMAGIWIAVLYVNVKIRTYFVEFLGDVAAYITPHAAHEYYEIRQAIQKRAKDVARAVYSMKNDTGTALRYHRVVMVGHSLGSVVAYDTVNALMLDDGTGVQPLIDVHKRTSHLITFGSPLDKTAFIFREQQQSNSQVRESLAANVQPLVRDYDNRKYINWANLWSPADPISGSLDYYDASRKSTQWKSQAAHRVVNLRDEYSSVFLLAHTMYWQSPLLSRVLLTAIQGREIK